MPLRRRLPFLLLAVGCAPEAPGTGLSLPDGAREGDEIVLSVALTADGDWADADAPGTLLEAQLGENLPRHTVVPGGVGRVTQQVALGAWDGGEVRVETVVGDEDALADAIAAGDLSLTVAPDAAGTPLLGSFDARWENDTPLVVWAEDGLWTWVFTDEDGGTGLLPTLLMASWGRPVDIEGLWDETSGTIQTTDHAWVPFTGQREGTHPLFQVVTANGLVGPYEDAPWVLAPVSLPFRTAGTRRREEVLDDNPWVLAASWAEARREGLVAEDGGQDDARIGAPDDYIFLDYAVSGGARVSFEAEVDGAWWSSLNGLPTSGLTDATVSGTGRTCIELPPGAGPGDVTAVRVRGHAGEGTAEAEWFAYDPARHTRADLGAGAGVPVQAGSVSPL